MTSDPFAVIGDDLGGLAAACTLAGRGYPVTLFESSRILPQQFGTIAHAGFHFDAKPSFFTFPRALDRIFRECNRKLADYLDLISVDPQCRCFFPNGRVLDICRDLDATCTNLERLTPGAGTEFRRLVASSERVHHAVDKLLYWRTVGGLQDMLRLDSLLSVSSLKLWQSLSRLIRRNISEPHIVRLIENLICFPHARPNVAPAHWINRLFVQFSEGVWHPRGGNRGIAQSLARLATEVGVDMQAKCVTQMEEAARGPVIMSSLESDINRESVFDTCTVFLGMNRTFEHLGHHNFILPNSADRGPGTMLYVSAASYTDTMATPSPGETLAIIFSVPRIPADQWSARWPEYRAAMIHTLATLGQMPNIEKNIQSESIAFSSTSNRSLPRFTPNRNPDSVGQYYAGPLAQLGPGIAMEIMSGWIAADTLDEDAYRVGNKPTPASNFA
jgi:phytoene dehydrogenase-like protein